MTLEGVLKYYGSTYKFEKETKMSHTNLTVWKRKGYIPIRSQLKLQQLTKGKLKAGLEGFEHHE